MIQMVAPATVWLKPQEGLNPVGCTTQPTATAAAADARAAAKGKEKGEISRRTQRETQRGSEAVKD
jgi:hypothetical protein